MSPPPTNGARGLQLRSERLLLRRWRASDLEPFSAINADPVVMEHFPATLSRDASARLAARIEEGFERDGYGLWAVEVVDRTPFAGFVGLARVDIDVAFAPAVELGWRLARDQWGRGIASEAAIAAATFALRDLALPEVVAYTSARNARSRAVMKRLGMVRDPVEDFAHPSLPATHPLSAHVLYRLTAEQLATG